jgi:hypothetical protein
VVCSTTGSHTRVAVLARKPVLPLDIRAECRISGSSSMTNVTADAYVDISLFLFHVFEYIDVDYLIDESSERWRRSTRRHS